MKCEYICHREMRNIIQLTQSLLYPYRTTFKRVNTVVNHDGCRTVTKIRNGNSLLDDARAGSSKSL